MPVDVISPSERSILQGVVRDEIALMLDEGGGRPRDVARRVCALYPELVSRLGQQLVEEAVTAIARKEFKKWASVGEETHKQLALPSLASHLRRDLPASISVPPVDPDNESDPVYRPLTGPAAATVGELRRAITALWQGIANDQRKAKALSDLLELLLAAGVSDDVRVDDALKQLDDCGVAS